MKKTLALVCFLSFMLFASACFSAGALTIEAVGNNHLYEDNTFSKPLSKGCLVEVILDRDGDGLDPIDTSLGFYPADDDILLPVLSGKSTFGIGDDLPPFTDDGQFSVTVAFDNEDPAPNYTGYRIYVRFWNSPNPQNNSLYGEAGPFVLEGGLKPQTINIIDNYDLVTDKLLE